jgi:hypothetical protein
MNPQHQTIKTAPVARLHWGSVTCLGESFYCLNHRGKWLFTFSLTDLMVPS